jgi:hypothetical protein
LSIDRFGKGDLKRLIGEEGRRFVALGQGKILFESDKRGILPLYSFIEGSGEEAVGAWVGDTVVGRGGALLLVKARAHYLYAGLISEGACEILQQHGIPFDFGKRVPKILNREKTGFCPVETLTAGIDDPEEAWAAVGRFLNELKA